MFYVDTTKCAGCGKCIKTCRQGAIKLVNQKADINNKLCNECGMCFEICPNGAVVEYQESSNNVQPKTNTGVAAMRSKNTGIATALAGMFQAVYDLFALRQQNRVVNPRGQHNNCADRRGRGPGPKKRGRGRGRGRGRF